MYLLNLFSVLLILSMISIYSIIGLGISIIIYNKKLIESINNNNIDEINSNKSTLKKLLIVLLVLTLFTYLGIILYSYIYNKKSSLIYTRQRNILKYSIPVSVISIIIFTSIFIYFNVILNRTEKDNLNLIYYIIPLIVTINTFVYYFFIMNLQYITNQLRNFTYSPENFISTPTITRTPRSITRTPSIYTEENFIDIDM